MPTLDKMSPSAARRVLIIDDNVDFAEMLKELLQIHRHSVTVAFSGEKGLEAAHQCKPDVVLCDIGLPVMDGYQVARAFRSDADLRDTFLVAITGYDMFRDKQRAADAGFDIHLTKPPDFEVIERILESPVR